MEPAWFTWVKFVCGKLSGMVGMPWWTVPLAVVVLFAIL